MVPYPSTHINKTIMSAKSLLQKLALLVAFISVSFLSKGQLSAQFSLDPTTPPTGCIPLVVKFVDQSTGNPTLWNWYYAVAPSTSYQLFSNLQNPSNSFFNAGAFSIKLVITNAAGTKDSIIKTSLITAFPTPTVSFTGTPRTGCFPLQVAFSNTSVSTGSPIVSCSWNFGDGYTSTDCNPNHTYSNSGSYNVTLTVTNAAGCTKTLQLPNYINVSSGVVPAFTNTTPIGCAVPSTITFTNQSTGAGTLSYVWNFGDGLPPPAVHSTSTNPTHTYSTAGNFSVTLTVTSTTGCVQSITQNSAVVIGTVNSDFTTPTSVCVGQTFTVTNTSSPTPTANNWNFDFGNNPANYTSTAQNPTHSYSVPGTYTIKLKSLFGSCADSITHTIIVFPKPSSQFTAAPLTACKPPLNVTFTSTAVGATSYEWHFGDGTFATTTLPITTHLYNSTGTYSDTLITINANGCKDTSIRASYVQIQAPVAVINGLPQKGCAPFTWNFSTNITTVDPIVGYQWFSNNVLFSTAATPTQVFPIGVYNIMLVVTTAGGCTDTVRVANGIKANVKPVPGFSANPRVSCAIYPIVFTDTTSLPHNECLWHFGDDEISQDCNPTHAYNDTGAFTVTLIVGNDGCYDSVTYVNYIYINPPIASFLLNKDCIDKHTISFTNTSIGADTYAWYFGDITPASTQSTIANPSHTYTQVGVYSGYLTVHNNITGCDNIKAFSVTIADEVAAFTPSIMQLCRGGSSTFTATSPNTPNYIGSFAWDFGDLTTGTGNPITHTYASSGSYNVKLLITDVNGCKDSLTQLNLVQSYGPISNFTASTNGACLNTPITFNSTSTSDGIHPIIDWTWDYEHPSTPQVYTAPPFQHSYLLTGSYNVKLVVTDSYGCKDSLLIPNLINISKPTANFTSINVPSCPNVPIPFASTSSGIALTYLWNFGDAANNPSYTSTAQNPTHVYLVAGSYTITLTVTDTSGCTDTKVDSFAVNILTPVANFTINQSTTTCPPLNSQFTNTSINALSYQWYFDVVGNPNSFSTIQNPAATYTLPGTYYVKLKVLGAGGCTSEKLDSIKVRGPQGSFTYSPLVGCNPFTVNFVGTSTDNVTYRFDCKDGVISPDTAYNLFTHTYTFTGKYLPQMILRDTGGCIVPIVGLDTIRVNGVDAEFKADSSFKCGSGLINFTNLSLSTTEPIIGYEWDFGDVGVPGGPFTPSLTQTPLQTTASHNYTSVGLFYPRLRATSLSGCTKIFTDSVPIKIASKPDVTTSQSANKCVTSIMNFNSVWQNPDTSAMTYTWNFTHSTIPTTTPISGNGPNLVGVAFPVAGIWNGTMLVVNSSGCKDTANTTLEVYPKPIVNAGNDIKICKGTGQTLTATGAATYVWSPATGLSCTNCASTIANPDSVRNYVVTGTSAFGCINTDTVKVSVQYPFDMPNGTNAVMCVGASKVFTTSGAIFYDWSPSIGLNTITGPTVIATPPNTTNYRVIGRDSSNCFSDSAYFFVKVYPKPTINAGPDKTINVGQSVVLTPTITDVTDVTWTPTATIVGTSFPSVTVKPNVDTKYKVVATNPGGCVTESFVTVYVICDDANVFIPNTFSPNGDGSNEIFYPRGTGLFTVKSFRIFNRWGEQVFEKYNFKPNNESAGWNGTFKGQKLLPDVYVYLMDIQCESGTILPYKGNIALIK
jgi:gliding motility-associated-like protein